MYDSRVSGRFAISKIMLISRQFPKSVKCIIVNKKKKKPRRRKKMAKYSKNNLESSYPLLWPVYIYILFRSANTTSI